MNRLPWAPLNAGVFLIILAGVFLLALFNVGATLGTALPIIFLLFGIWMITEAFVIPPSTAYSPPKSMIVIWGAFIGIIGMLWFVGATSLGLLPIALVVIVMMIGIAGVGYSFLRAKPGPSKTPTS